MIDREKFVGDDIDSIDEKIDEVANDNLDALEDTLDHIDEIDDETFSDLQDTAKEKIDYCSKYELKKVLELLINIARK